MVGARDIKELYAKEKYSILLMCESKAKSF